MDHYDETGVMPASMQNKPELYLHLIQVWVSFNLIKNCRMIMVSEFGQSIGRLSFTDMQNVLSEMAVHDLETRVYYIQLLQVLDTVYIEWIRKHLK